MSLREKFLRERQRSDAQRPEVWLLRDLLKQRRARRDRSRLSLAVAAPDRPVLVAGGRTVGRLPFRRDGRPTTSEGRTE